MARAQQALVDYAVRHLAVKTNLCTLQHHERGYRLLPRMVGDYNLIYVTRGRVTWVVDNLEHPMAPCDLVIVPPQLLHNGFSVTDAMTFVSIHVESYLPGGQNVFEMLRVPRFQHVRPDCALDRYLRGAAEELGSRDEAASRLMLVHWGELIVRELLLHGAREGVLEAPDFDPTITAVLLELEKSIPRPLSLSDLARKSGYSSQYLNRMFRSALGATPLQYLNRMRMERAATLLRDGLRTVKSVARSVGFDDPYYFSRAFTAYFGRSPVSYRDTLLSDSPSEHS
jgi:AraC-like DNA-binding protein